MFEFLKPKKNKLKYENYLVIYLTGGSQVFYACSDEGLQAIDRAIRNCSLEDDTVQISNGDFKHIYRYGDIVYWDLSDKSLQVIY